MREQSIRCSDQIVLSCSCGEKIVLIGRLTDWYDQEQLEFDCECGRSLTFSDALHEELYALKT
jgi:hypothetical protein